MQASSPVSAMHVARFRGEGVQTILAKRPRQVAASVFYVDVVDQSVEQQLASVVDGVGSQRQSRNSPLKPVHQLYSEENCPAPPINEISLLHQLLFRHVDAISSVPSKEIVSPVWYIRITSTWSCVGPNRQLLTVMGS